MKNIAVFAGTPVLNLVIQQLNSVGNVIDLQMDVHARYDEIEWGIQADKGLGKVQIQAILGWIHYT